MPLPADAPEPLQRMVMEAAQHGVVLYFAEGTVNLGAERPPPADLLARFLSERAALAGWFLAANNIAPL
jgi:hypothetical protein